MQDPIADMLTRIRNGQMANLSSVSVPMSKIKEKIAQVLKDEGYITDFDVHEVDGKQVISIALKYYQGTAVIDRIKRISKPGLRKYISAKDLKAVSGFGIAILSTSKGVMSHVVAKKLGVGGEILCEVA
jgi:small subunit ribosomal protein S8